MKVVVTGTEYVGLVKGTCFAENGAAAICADNNKKKIKTLEEGSVRVCENGQLI